MLRLLELFCGTKSVGRAYTATKQTPPGRPRADKAACPAGQEWVKRSTADPAACQIVEHWSDQGATRKRAEPSRQTGTR